MANYYVDDEGGEYCDTCAPDDAGAWPCAEADTPRHCAECGETLDASLTAEGVEYVVEAALEWLAKPSGEWREIIPRRGTAAETLSYFHGSPAPAIVAEWVDLLGAGNVDERGDVVVDLFRDRYAAECAAIDWPYAERVTSAPAQEFEARDGGRVAHVFRVMGGYRAAGREGGREVVYRFGRFDEARAWALAYVTGDARYLDEATV